MKRKGCGPQENAWDPWTTSQTQALFVTMWPDPGLIRDYKKVHTGKKHP